MAKKFQYKLQPLLNVKIQMEDSMKNELGKAIKALEEQKEILVQIQLERESCIKAINDKTSGGVTVKELRGYNSYLSVLKEKAVIQKQHINKAQQNVDKYREELIKVVQERKMLESLKEKKYIEYLKEEQKQEQKINDEIVSYSYNHKLSGE